MIDKIKKYIYMIFIFVFILLFSYFKWPEYYNFYKKANSQKIAKSIMLDKIKSFSIWNIKEINNIDFYYTPYKKTLDDLIYKINNAKNKVFVEVYMLTETRIQKALVNAKNRWLDVKVILEKNPYKSPWLNKKAFNFLKSRWVDVVYSNPNNFSLNHSKMIIIDNDVFLSTWNFTYSTFTKNREFMLFINNKDIYSSLNKIFLWDYKWIKTYIYNNNLVISPNYSRIKLEKLLLSAHKIIKLYFPYLEDEKLEKILISKVKKWINIKLITWIYSSKDSDIINKFRKNWIYVKVLKEPKIHAKAILVDNTYLYIGSINFSRYSLDTNREIWIIFKNNFVVNKFLKVFLTDFKK